MKPISSVSALVLLCFLMYFGLKNYPNLILKTEFLSGFVFCTLVFLLLYLTRFLFKKSKPTNSANAFEIFVLPLTLLLLLLLLIAIPTLKHYGNHQEQIKNLESLVNEAKLNEQNNQSLALLIKSSLQQCKEEAKTNHGKLTEETIQQFIDLSHTIYPTQIKPTDSTGYKLVSPQRGLLLKTILTLNLDSTTLQALYKGASFEYADLENAKFENVYLCGAKLSFAQLKNAKIHNSNLSNIQLDKANLWGADLTGSNLSSAQLNRANLNWSIINEIDLSAANLGNAKLENSKGVNTNFENAYLKFSFAKGAYWKGANLNGTDCFGADFRNINLTQAELKAANLRNIKGHKGLFNSSNFNEAVLRGAQLSKANLKNVKLEGVFVQGKDWLEKLSQLSVIGADSLKIKYKLISESSFSENFEIKQR